MVKLYFFALLLSLTSSSLLPQDFAWGSATAAFQVEGAWNLSGRGACIWDYFQSFPNVIHNNDTAHIADDFYDRYASDILLMQQLGIKSFRLSFSWTRLLPTGDVDNINQAGVAFYNQLLDALLSAGIEPYVTLYHWDLPQTYNNLTNTSTWLDPDMPNKFNRYADFCFATFGSKVKYWLTMNEIQTFAWIGYGVGVHAPGRCSPSPGNQCQQIGGGGNSSTEPYIVGHNALLAHALAVQTYRTKYQSQQQGKIGMTINSGFALPWNSSVQADVQAVNTAVAFSYGWFADPMVFGQYPPEMTSVITGNRLPTFNSSMSQLIKGSFDFLGLNYYASFYVNYTGVVGDNFGNDGRYATSPWNASGYLIGPFAASPWLNVYPEGLRGILNWIRRRYGNPPVYIFENGVSCPGENDLPEDVAIHDNFRMNYVYNHVMNMMDAIVNDGCNVHGYFLWSLLDNFEWADGYSVRFGITYVNYEQNLTRTIKDSGYLYQSLIQYLGETEKLDRTLSPYFHIDRVKELNS
jgi:beta-glucosidase